MVFQLLVYFVKGIVFKTYKINMKSRENVKYCRHCVDWVFFPFITDMNG